VYDDFMTQPLHPHVVLGVAAHPDDIDFGAAGSLAKWAAAGAQIHLLILTTGAKGTADQTVKPEELVQTRQAEQQAAAKELGLASVIFGTFEDGQLANNVEVKREIIRQIRTLRPDTAITWDPACLYVADLGFINHPDHRAAGQATLDAVYPLARDHLSYPELLAEGLEPHKVKTVLLMTPDPHQANHFEDITVQLDQKLAAVRRHVSQASDAHLRETKARAEAAGILAGFKAAEGFMRIDVRE
jgi:LmbE family N-acetylglucosaminyl deacetylase